jgi:hypothetical protein
MFFASLQRSIQAFNFHQCEINGLDREQAEKAAENGQNGPHCLCIKSTSDRESREFLDFFQSPK